jgi:hypothetical protein
LEQLCDILGIHLSMESRLVISGLLRLMLQAYELPDFRRDVVLMTEQVSGCGVVMRTVCRLLL